MLKIGLTGGIACGKTTIAKIFANFGVPIIDADQIAHHLVEKDQPGLDKIRQLFGAAVIHADGTLNRSLLKELIFRDAEQKLKLESMLHPLVYQSIQIEIELLSAPYCIITVPLLIETGMTHLVNRILVVDCPVETQIQRASQRDRISLEIIQAIIQSQVPRAVRLSHADDVLDNSDTNCELAEQVKKLHNFYLSLSAC